VSLPGRESAYRRFTAVWAASAVAKLAGLALFLYLVLKITGGSL
jgi:hypothetical protein